MQLFIAMGSMSTEICTKLFTRSSRNKRRDRQHLFSISLSFYKTNLQSIPQSRYMFDINYKKLLLIDVLKSIPRETHDLLSIAIDLPESR